MQILITYTTGRENAKEQDARRMKDLLKAKGYQDYITGLNAKGEKIKSCLPDNALWRDRITPKEARADLKAAAKFCGVTIDCCIAAEIMEWSGISAKRTPEMARPGEESMKRV